MKKETDYRIIVQTLSKDSTRVITLQKYFSEKIEDTHRLEPITLRA
jgi:hypothetical protein